MPQDVSLFRAFVASLNDVEAERTAARDVILRWNAANSLQRKVSIEPIMRETHSESGIGSEPQSFVNPLLERCDLLIAIFWTRLGSPTEKYESGTIEELERFSAEKGG